MSSLDKGNGVVIDPEGRYLVVDEQSAHIVATGPGWGSAVPIVVRVSEDGDDRQVLFEAPLGLSWRGANAPPPAWTELARRADVALAEHGYTRTMQWEPHVYPRPIAGAKVAKSVRPCQ